MIFIFNFILINIIIKCQLLTNASLVTYSNNPTDLSNLDKLQQEGTTTIIPGTSLININSSGNKTPQQINLEDIAMKSVQDIMKNKSIIINGSNSNTSIFNLE